MAALRPSSPPPPIPPSPSPPWNHALDDAVMPWILAPSMGQVVLHTDLMISIYKYWPTLQVPRGQSLRFPDGAERSHFYTVTYGDDQPRYPSIHDHAVWEGSHDLACEAIRKHGLLRNAFLRQILQVALVSRLWKQQIDLLLPPGGTILPGGRAAIHYPLALGAQNGDSDSECSWEFVILHHRSVYLTRLDTHILLNAFVPACAPKMVTTADQPIPVYVVLRQVAQATWNPEIANYVHEHVWVMQKLHASAFTRSEDVIPFWFRQSTSIPKFLAGQIVLDPVPTGIDVLFTRTRA